MTIRDKSEYERKGKEISSYPSEYDNKDYGKKRKAKIHTIAIKNTTSGEVYGYKTIPEVLTLTFSDFLAEAQKDTRLPQSVIGELTGLIRKGAKDLDQAWKSAIELVHTAYHVANVKRPTPDQKGAWKQYEDLLKAGVKALADARGLSGDWRLSQVAYSEGVQTPELDQILTEASGKRAHRIFVRTKDIGFDDKEHEHEVNADSLDDVVHSVLHQARANGKHVKIIPVAPNQIKLVVYTKGVNKNKEEQIVNIKDWSA